MKRRLILSLATLLAAPAANAGTLDLTYVGSVSGYRVVTIDAVPVTVAGNDHTVNAGGFQMEDTGPSGFGSFIAWCLDLCAYLGSSGTHEHEETDTPFQNGRQSPLPDSMARLSSIFNANFGDAVTVSAEASAPFQLALWRVIHDVDMNIDTGPFQASSSNSAVETLASDYLSAALTYSGPSVFDLIYLESTAAHRRQNLVNATPTPVPVPAAGVLLLVGLGGLAGLKRRKV